MQSDMAKDAKAMRQALAQLIGEMRAEGIGDPDALSVAVDECPDASLAKLAQFLRERE